MSETGVQQSTRIGGLADIGALLLPACSERVLGCQASATRQVRGRTLCSRYETLIMSVYIFLKFAKMTTTLNELHDTILTGISRFSGPSCLHHLHNFTYP